jgi:hypothetical protein
MLLEGLKFARGDMQRITRPQLRFLNEFVSFKINIKKGKKMSRAGAGVKQTISGTPEQIHQRMWPKIQAEKEFAKKAEIKAADDAIKTWEKLNDPKRH